MYPFHDTCCGYLNNLSSLHILLIIYGKYLCRYVRTDPGTVLPLEECFYDAAGGSLPHVENK